MAVNVYRELGNELQLVGMLERERRDEASFRYAESYLSSPDAHAISLSLPLTCEPYGPEATRPYFDGLLPEGPSRTRLAMEVGCREEDYLALLAHCGLDCIGDVVVDSESFSGERAYEPVALKDVAAQSRRSGGIAQMLQTSRLTIAGVQNKVGIFHDDSTGIQEGWFKPVGGAPSNFIVKFANDELSDLIELEHLCLAAARGCGIDTAATTLLFPDRPVLCVKRFDRLESSHQLIDGLYAPVRQHQEDMAQALGISSESKYTELEPSTASAIAAFIADHSVSPALDIAAFARISLFNYAIGNCDNHLKNYSLLYSHNWSAVRLAPAYDLTSTTHYARFSTEMGMMLGKTRDIEAVNAKDILAFAQQIGIAEKVVERIAAEIAACIIPALKAAALNLAENGFADAPYLFDELEEELRPRLEVLNEAAKL